MKRKIFKIIYILVLLAIVSGFSLLDAQNKIKTVVIDPGHGGTDPGAVGKISKEKDLVLKISLQFGEYIKKHFPDVKVVYTRSDDKDVELYKRAEIANKNKADLFISIHINSFKNGTPYGTETFVMGISKNAANLEVAKLENSVILKEENYKNNYDGFDPNDPENHILFSLYQNSNLNQSLLLAQLTQEKFTNNLKRFDRGVKQERFLVLWKTTMPSVLVELGFISNFEEEKYLNSEKGQKDLATALFDSFVEYKSQYEDQSHNIKFEYSSNESKTSEKKEDSATKITENITKSEDVKKIEKDNTSKAENIEKPEKDIKNIENNNTSNSKQYPEDQVVYKIQIKISPKQLELKPENFKSYKNISEYFQNGMYKYTVGEETDFNKINDFYKKVKVDFKDCFIVKFKNGERI